MELTVAKFKIRCEMGVCGNFADYALRLKRSGAAEDIYFCKDCLLRLYGEIGRVLVPKSPANAFGRYLKKGVLTSAEIPAAEAAGAVIKNCVDGETDEDGGGTAEGNQSKDICAEAAVTEADKKEDSIICYQDGGGTHNADAEKKPETEERKDFVVDGMKKLAGQKKRRRL